ncbi:hypoxanthine phosphoribosyltransferase [Desulfovibrio sp. OttesenSCG-928-A18]|nr:hypoxanthine phosphoribosyltransferase [Desulfovibrio sp. OttesenSCG-928-A18]
MRVKALHQLYSSEEIALRVAELAGRINHCYRDGQLVMICVLKGAFMFFSDLLKLINVGPEIDFVRVASYGHGDTSSGTVSLLKDVETDLAGRHVLLVEDVVDTGATMDFLLARMRAAGAKTLRLAALVDKVERRRTDLTVDFPGFSLSEGFIVGYGLDYAERYRELPAIYTIEFEDA